MFRHTGFTPAPEPRSTRLREHVQSEMLWSALRVKYGIRLEHFRKNDNPGAGQICRPRREAVLFGLGVVFFAVVHLFCGGHDDLVEEGHDERRKRGSRQHAEYHADADGTAA